MASDRIFLIALIASMLVLPGYVQGLSVNLAPPTIDAGDMLPGDSKSFEFVIMSDQDSDIIVDLSKKKPSRNFFDPEKARFRYKFISQEASEEDITSWATLIDDTVIVPEEKSLQQLEGGGAAYANEKVRFILEIPENAEPGYHAGFITPYPRPQSKGEGTGIGIITVSEMAYVVNVLGNPQREAEYVGINFVRDTVEYGTLSVLIKNTGTVTISAIADDVNLVGSDGLTLYRSSSAETAIAPGEIGSLDVFIETKGMEGRVSVIGHVEWITGKQNFSDSIEIGEYVPIPKPSVTGKAVSPVPSPPGLPLWIIPLLLVGVGAVVFWRFR